MNPPSSKFLGDRKASEEPLLPSDRGRLKHPHHYERLGVAPILVGLFRSSEKVKQETQDLKKREETATSVIDDNSVVLSNAEWQEYKSVNDRLEYDKLKLTEVESSPRTLFPSIARARWSERWRIDICKVERMSQTTTSKLKKQNREERRQRGLEPVSEFLPESEPSKPDARRGYSEPAPPPPPNLHRVRSEAPETSGHWEVLYQRCKAAWAAFDSTSWIPFYPPEQTKAIETCIPAITEWLDRVHSRSRIYWLWQKSDAGKDNVLRHIAHRCVPIGPEQVYHLGASFFFPEIPITERAIKKVFIPTLAGELARFLPSYKYALDDICKSGLASQIEQNRLDLQASRLIVQGYDKLPSDEKTRPILVLLNGLDRCSTGVYYHILSVMELCIQRLPVCFIVSSRDTVFLRRNVEESSVSSYVTHGVYEVPEVSSTEADSEDIPAGTETLAAEQSPERSGPQ
ncbi:hypothetical protein DFP72DRAFT_151902 [Ephemerocybe angulata]|uniref:Nephrocystin 3-like N-terminal domain-containing protein n=1 Tax=Ephemerocybe angulata TaxID=980116 RepID=A0A8H6LVU1_9AGAR|nr:hypothetical protein DFP72DRAFT_151902 [Tulosesus angulatus]